jgi:hypothetical protein
MSRRTLDALKLALKVADQGGSFAHWSTHTPGHIESALRVLDGIAGRSRGCGSRGLSLGLFHRKPGLSFHDGILFWG